MINVPHIIVKFLMPADSIAPVHLRPSAWNLLFFLADLRWFYLRPSAWNLHFFSRKFTRILSASICVYSICVHLRETIFSFLADLRGFYLLPSASLQSAPICVKSSSFLADLRGFVLRPSAWNLHLFSLIYADFFCVYLRENLFFSHRFTRILSASICVSSICDHLREIISFFLADWRWFVLRPYAWSHL